MLADLIAASTPPAAPGPHDAYDWWSDIWLPAIVGFGSIGAAAAAVIVAWRSNEVAQTSAEAAQRATAAAERSNELTHEALLHERAQAKVTAERVTEEARAKFADRVTARFDLLFDAQADWSEEASLHIGEVGTLALESIANGWNALGLNDWVQFSLRVRPRDEEQRRRYFQDHRQAVHTMMAAWVKDPSNLQRNREYFERRLRMDYPDELDRD